MRNLGGAIGIAACATILNDRTNLHFTRLAEHLNSSNEALNQWLAQVGGNLAHWVRAVTSGSPPACVSCGC
jgi:DHA2 family multidrug resistance protein